MSSKTPKIDPSSPIPLYHQIAEAIRARIEAGELAPGEALEPLRQAAESWNVNLHTVRHAYAALARSGLVESRRGRGGTRVVGRPAGPDRQLGTYARRIAEEAERLYGATPAELANTLLELGARDTGVELPQVWVVECSAWQRECHAREVAERFRVDAWPWPLGEEEPPDGVVVSTYFHYNDVRRLWPRRLGTVRFCGIHPDPALVDGIGDAKRLIVAERDSSTVEAITADLVALLGDSRVEIEPRVADDPRSCLTEDDDAPVLIAPRVWADLDDATRAHPRALELRYVFDSRELERLGASERWESRRTSKTGRAGRGGTVA